MGTRHTRTKATRTFAVDDNPSLTACVLQHTSKPSARGWMLFQLRCRPEVKVIWLITIRWKQHVGFDSHHRYHFVFACFRAGQLSIHRHAIATEMWWPIFCGGAELASVFFGFHNLLDCSSAEPRRNGCGVLLTWWSVGGFFDFIFG